MSEQVDLEKRVERLEKTVLTMAAWLAQTPGVWGERDYRAVKRMLDGEQEVTAK